MHKLSAILLGMTLTLSLVLSAQAQDTDTGIYGPIDTSKFPHPPVIIKRPVTADRAAKHRSSVKPIYLHVPPGEEWHWYAHCGTYSACSTPVYFLKESWFANIYLPAIGSRDGREQRYRIVTARERAIGTMKSEMPAAVGHIGTPPRESLLRCSIALEPGERSIRLSS